MPEEWLEALGRRCHTIARSRSKIQLTDLYSRGVGKAVPADRSTLELNIGVNEVGDALEALETEDHAGSDWPRHGCALMWCPVVQEVVDGRFSVCTQHH